MIKLTFGNSLANTPIGKDLGNFGFLNFPHDLRIVKQGNNYFGFTVNFLTNSIARFSFGTSINNDPIATNLGNIGNLEYPVGIALLEENNGICLLQTKETIHLFLD